MVEAGASEDTAERAVEKLPPNDELATKADWAELDARIAQLEARLTQLEVRFGTDIAQLEVRLTWRLLGGTAVLLGITVGLLKLVLG